MQNTDIRRIVHTTTLHTTNNIFSHVQLSFVIYCIPIGTVCIIALFAYKVNRLRLYSAINTELSYQFYTICAMRLLKKSPTLPSTLHLSITVKTQMTNCRDDVSPSANNTRTMPFAKTNMKKGRIISAPTNYIMLLCVRFGLSGTPAPTAERRGGVPYKLLLRRIAKL